MTQTSVRVPMHYGKGEWMTWYNMPKTQMPKGFYTKEVKRLRALGLKVKASTNEQRFFIMVKNE